MYTARKMDARCWLGCWEQCWVDSVCLKMEEKVHLKVWVKLGCFPGKTQVVPKWHLDG